LYFNCRNSSTAKAWLDYKYRYHRSCYIDKNSGNYKSEYITPIRKPDDLIFATYGKPSNIDLRVMYVDIAASYAKTLDRIGRGEEKTTINAENYFSFI
jgi:hypothetical protein